MHLLGRAQLVLPAWEPDQGWRVLDPDGHVVDAGGKTIITAEFIFGELFGKLPPICASRHEHIEVFLL